MKKDVVRGVLSLAVLLVVYNLIVFLIPFHKNSVFWASYGFTLVAFLVTAAAFYIAFFKKTDAKSRFYGFPIAKIGVGYGAVQLVLGLVFMALGKWIPGWAAVLVSAVCLGIALVGLISADAAAETVQVQDEKLKKDVSLMRSLSSKLNRLAGQCEDRDTADAVKKLAEEMRYSDPVSSEALAEVEAELSAVVEELQQAVGNGENAAVRQLCRKVTVTLTERNRLCRMNKHWSVVENAMSKGEE